ncbi:SagB family peptide dehydrogenase [Nonomuraea sp. NPDC050663]|uniref:SagB family peptide dehydrogenase n=1 Tax=Nonomuraea sp. NPDC050663 TaxID=3364370 RepID=UPI0037B947D8
MRSALVCEAGGVRLAEAVLTSRLARPGPAPDPGGTLRLSRFAALRRHGEHLVLESPVAGYRVTLLRPRDAVLVSLLARPRTVTELQTLAPDPGTGPLVAFLAGLGLLVPAAANGLTPEDLEPPAALREFHDVWAHALSRTGLTDARLGGTNRFDGRHPRPPALRADAPGEPIPLAEVDLDRLRRDDPTLSDVMERRRSVREFGRRPIHADRLSELLHRVARLTGVGHDGLLRPVPSAGGLHELEYYLAVRTCEGLAPGLYRYRPADHTLVPVPADVTSLVRILDHAHRAMGGTGVPHVVLTLAARFGRQSWKYEGISYALTLKNAGVVLEAVCLAATAMGLAACPLGGGDSAAFATATGLDPLEESSVAEIALGSPPDREEP